MRTLRLRCEEVQRERERHRELGGRPVPYLRPRQRDREPRAWEKPRAWGPDGWRVVDPTEAAPLLRPLLLERVYGPMQPAPPPCKHDWHAEGPEAQRCQGCGAKRVDEEARERRLAAERREAAEARRRAYDARQRAAAEVRRRAEEDRIQHQIDLRRAKALRRMQREEAALSRHTVAVFLRRFYTPALVSKARGIAVASYSIGFDPEPAVLQFLQDHLAELLTEWERLPADTGDVIDIARAVELSQAIFAPPGPEDEGLDPLVVFSEWRLLRASAPWNNVPRGTLAAILTQPAE